MKLHINYSIRCMLKIPKIHKESNARIDRSRFHASIQNFCSKTLFSPSNRLKRGELWQWQSTNAAKMHMWRCCCVDCACVSNGEYTTHGNWWRYSQIEIVFRTMLMCVESKQRQPHIEAITCAVQKKQLLSAFRIQNLANSERSRERI